MLGWEKGLLEKRWNISTHKTGTGSIVEAQILPVFFFYICIFKICGANVLPLSRLGILNAAFMIPC